MYNSLIETKDINVNEIDELINYDEIHLQNVMKEGGLANDELAPPLTRDEIFNALHRRDYLKWIFFEDQLAGYFWFEIKPDSFYVNAIAIDRIFQGKGIAQYILNLVDSLSKKHLLNSRLSVSPKNGRALNIYLKSGYKIVDAVSSLFGPEFPATFRVIMEKNQTKSETIGKIKDEINVACDNYETIKEILSLGYQGIQLIIPQDKDYSKNLIHFVKYEESFP